MLIVYPDGTPRFELLFPLRNFLVPFTMMIIMIAISTIVSSRKITKLSVIELIKI